MAKTINRTFKVTTGTVLTPDFENRCFVDKEFTLIDSDKIPDNAENVVTSTVKVSMPIEKFFELGEKTTVES